MCSCRLKPVHAGKRPAPGALFMSDPVLYSALGFSVAILLFCGMRLVLPWLRGNPRQRFEEHPLITEIEAEMGELHGQIAIATRRLEAGVAQMKAKTATQLSEIGQTSATIARLKAEIGERTAALQELTAKERSVYEQLSATEAELAIKDRALAETERKLAHEKAELDDVMGFVDARDRLGEAEKRHAAALEAQHAENRALEEQLGQSFDEITRLETEMATLKRQVEATWAAERMANAVLRERINDVAGEVVRVAHALEGLGSPIETMLAGKASELDALAGALNGGAAINQLPAITAGGDDSKGSLARRIRSLQRRAARVASARPP
jgi:chromosome segregation ATPase